MLQARQGLRSEEGEALEMGSRRFGSQRPRFSVDGSQRVVEELNRMPPQLKLKHGSNFAEQEHGAERYSAGGPARDSIEELRRVIKDSLCQQNLLSRSPEDDRACIIHQSQSSKFDRFKGLIYDGEEELPGSFLFSLRPITKAHKGPNLIAKLMGLEEVSAQTVVEPIKKQEKKMSLNTQRPTSDIERPTARKLQLVEEKKKKMKKAYDKQKSLQEIIESMQFKGLLTSTKVDVSRIKPRIFGSTCRNVYDEPPPIVIMKPLYLPQWVRADVHKNHRKQQGRLVLSKTVDQKEMKSADEKAQMDLSSISQKNQHRKEDVKPRKKKAEKVQKPLELGKNEEQKKEAQVQRMPKAPAKPEGRLSQANSKIFLTKRESKISESSTEEKQTVPKAKSDRIRSTDIQSNDKIWKGGKTSNQVYKMGSIPRRGNFLSTDKTAQSAQTEAKTCTDDNRENRTLSEETPKLCSTAESPTLTKVNSNAEVEDGLMHLLLGSRTFLAQAEELFRIHPEQPVKPQRNGVDADVMMNATLYLDCGKELMGRKSYQHEISIYGMSSRALICDLSLKQLAEDLSIRMRALNSYSTVNSNVTSDDIVNVRLERDLRCMDVLMSAMWDVGWVSLGSTEEAVEIAGEVGESMLFGLITEVAAELICLRERKEGYIL